MSKHDDWPNLKYYYVYDIECYPNFFSLTIVHALTGHRWIFEISERRNQAMELYSFLCRLEFHKCKMVGFNNMGYDYPLLHFFLETMKGAGWIDHPWLYAKSQQLIGTKWDDRFDNYIWEFRQVIQQVDLMMIHHFDNKAKRQSLKGLEFNMRAYNIATLPYDPLYPLTSEQMDKLLEYNCYDVEQTTAFFFHTKKMIIFREELTEKYQKSFMNYNDTKVGKQYFIMKLEQKMPGCTQDPVTKEKKTTHRETINLNDVLLPYIEFASPEFDRVLQYLRSTILRQTKAPPELKDLKIEAGTY